MSAKGLDNKEASRLLQEVAVLLELKGENPFKVKAYSNGARAVQVLETDLATLIQEGRLREIKGIGETIAQQIAELAATGGLGLYEELKASVPAGHIEMLRVPGLGPKKIKALYETLQIKNMGELEYACRENRLADLQGFGQKSQEKILHGIQQVKKYQGHYRYGDVIDDAREMLRQILTHPKVLRADLAGSLRRKMEVVRNINLLVSTHQPHDVLSALSRFAGVESVHHENTSRGLFSLSSGIEVDLRIVSDDLFASTLYHLTGSLAHLNSLREKVRALGFELNESGLRRGERLVRCKEEKEIFDALGLDFIPPELRENQGEIEFAEAHELPHLIEAEDIKGAFHVHSSYSDGTNSIKGTAREAMKLGFSYVGLSDHSQSARYAGGLTFERLSKQWEEIDEVNDELKGFHIFKGTESDILADGSLDYDETTLKKFDFVIASVHSHFNMPKEEMTRRVIKALRNPFTTILAHPTGRLLLAREPYAIDMVQIIDEAARSGVAIELNAHPFRLDIDWRLCKYAKEKGVKIAIDPDTHDRDGLKDTYFGVGIARKGWLEPGDVLNTMNLEEIIDFLKKRRKRF